MVEMPSIEYTKMYQVEDEMWWYQSLRRVVKSFATLLVPKGGTVLDAGCGTGKNVQLLEELGFDTAGIDLSAEGVEYCKQRGLKKVYVQSVTDIEFANNSFDGLICCDVLTTLTPEQSTQALREFYRVLKPKSFAFVQLAALPWLFSTHDKRSNVMHRYQRSELAELVRAEGFQVAHVSYRYFFVFPLLVLVKLMKKVAKPEGKSDLAVPNKVLNTVLKWWMSFEDAAFPVINWPIGSSVIVVIRKP